MLLPGVAISNEIDSHKELWESKRINSYSYTLKQGGVFGYSLYKIKIRDGVCKAKSKYISDRTPIFWKKSSCDDNTVEDLYKSVVTQVAKGVVKMELNFDKDYGFISYFTVEPKTDFTDQDWYFEITNFRVK